jgi:hypothetical protein
MVKRTVAVLGPVDDDGLELEAVRGQTGVWFRL